MATISVVPCPICDEPIGLETPVIGQEVECAACGEAYVLTEVEPVELAYAYDLEDEGEFYDEDVPRK